VKWEYLIVNLEYYLDNDNDLMISACDIPEKFRWITEKDYEDEVMIQRILDHLGENGWELSSTILLSGNMLSYTFKMPLSEGSDEEEDAYVNHCWNCHSEINSEHCDKCDECDWYECIECNACGCNKPF
jgi:hypothetical protein